MPGSRSLAGRVEPPVVHPLLLLLLIMPVMTMMRCLAGLMLPRLMVLLRLAPGRMLLHGLTLGHLVVSGHGCHSLGMLLAVGSRSSLRGVHG